MQKTHVNVANDKLSFILQNVFTEEECKEIIAEAEKKGFEEAIVNNEETEMKEVRKGGRCVIESNKKANFIWSRIRFHIPKKWDDNQGVLSLKERSSQIECTLF